MATEPARPAAAKSTATPEATRVASAMPLWGVLVAAAFVVVCAGMRQVQDLIGPAFLVVTLVITFQPIRNFLVRHKVPRWAASVIVLLMIYLAMLAILGAVVLSVTQLIQLLPRYYTAFRTLYNSGLNLAKQLGVDTSDWRGLLSRIDFGRVTDAAQGLLSGLTSGFSLAGLIILAAIFFTFDAASASKRLRAVALQRPHIAEAFIDFAGRVRRYWIVTSVFGLIAAILDVFALMVLGVPLAVTWGVLAFVTNYVPNIGFIIGVIPPALIAFLQGGLGTSIEVIVIYIVINFVVNTLLQPRITGDAVGINASVAFISLIFWSAILGALGALLAIPATLFVKVMLIDHSERANWFGAMVSSDIGPERKQPKGPRLPARRGKRPNQPSEPESTVPSTPG
jgi:AI-2 transport protein TqsA